MTQPIYPSEPQAAPTSSAALPGVPGAPAALPAGPVQGAPLAAAPQTPTPAPVALPAQPVLPAELVQPAGPGYDQPLQGSLSISGGPMDPRALATPQPVVPALAPVAAPLAPAPGIDPALADFLAKQTATLDRVASAVPVAVAAAAPELPAPPNMLTDPDAFLPWLQDSMGQIMTTHLSQFGKNVDARITQSQDAAREYQVVNQVYARFEKEFPEALRDETVLEAVLRDEMASPQYGGKFPTDPAAQNVLMQSVASRSYGAHLIPVSQRQPGQPIYTAAPATPQAPGLHPALAPPLAAQQAALTFAPAPVLAPPAPGLVTYAATPVVHPGEALLGTGALAPMTPTGLPATPGSPPPLPATGSMVDQVRSLRGREQYM